MLIYNNLSGKCEVIKARIHSDKTERLVKLNEDTEDILNSLKILVKPFEYLTPDAPADEALFLGYGYGEGEVKSPIRESDEFDDVVALRPWNNGQDNYLDLNTVLYHNQWKTFSTIVNVDSGFRIYLKYGNGHPPALCHIRGLKVNGQSHEGYPDMKTTKSATENPVYTLPNDWSKLFLLSPDERIEGLCEISFEYYVEDLKGCTDIPDKPRLIYGDLEVEEFNVKDEEWMDNLPFDSVESMRLTRIKGKDEYYRSLPDDTAKLTQQVTALEMALVDLYENMEGIV